MRLGLLLLLLACFFQLNAQVIELPGRPPRQPTSGPQQPGAPPDFFNNQSAKPDSSLSKLAHRDDEADKITLTYRFLDSTRRRAIDSSVTNFDLYYPLPSNWTNLGNNGAAAFPLLFEANHKPGFDIGFHAYDVYKLTLPKTKLYRTTRPFTSLGYQLASGKEQMIQIIHTQNPKPNFNFGFDYRLINAPGFFVTQNTNHSSYRIFGNFESRNKHYHATLVLLGNKIRASQNGGITADSLLADPNRKDRFSIPVNLGSSARFQTNPFSTAVHTGVQNNELTFYLMQSYDLGKKDSLPINDTTTAYFFYPRLRFQHTFTASRERFHYIDDRADSLIYKNWYNLTLDNILDTVDIRENWSIITNDFSIYQFPEIKNSSHFLKLGATLENIVRKSEIDKVTLHNIILHAEYRNVTRNKKWEALLKGILYANGTNNGDYQVYGQLSRMLPHHQGDVSLHFRNSNISPSFVNGNRSFFSLGAGGVFKKQNNLSFGASGNWKKWKLSVTNHLLNNYIFYTNKLTPAQSSTVINISCISASGKLSLTKKWNLYADVSVQHTGKNAPVHLPTFFTRQQLAYEGVYFKNLNLSTGLDFRYYSPYKANDFSPLNGQFVFQDSVTIRNRPDIALFLHFRIRSFTGYIRAENLNTLDLSNGFSFTHNNFAAPLYPTPGMIIRFGIRWWFVN